MLLNQADWLDAFRWCVDGLHTSYCMWGWWSMQIGTAVHYP